jgi:hypothetical protein
MDLRKPICVAIAAAGLAAAGCRSTAPLSAVPPPMVTFEGAELADARFAAGAALLSGFDALEDGPWKLGDSVLLGIGIERPGRAKELYLKITAMPKFPEIRLGDESLVFRDAMRVRYTPHDSQADGGWVRLEYDLVPLQVELFDDSAKLIFKTISMMPEPCLRHGLIDNIELERSGGSFYDELPPAEAGQDRIAGERQLRLLAGWMALMRLPQFLHRESMQGLVWDIVEKPSLLSVLRSGGVSLGLAMQAKDAELVEPPPLGAEIAYRVPLVVQVNDRPALECTLLLARATPPLGPCNGLLAIEGVNPKDSRKRLTVRLLAARRDQIPESLMKHAVPLPSTPHGESPLPPPSPPAQPAAASPAGNGP